MKKRPIIFLNCVVTTWQIECRITLSGAISRTVKLGTDVYGNITRLDNALAGFEDNKYPRAENTIASTKEQLEAAKG